MTGKLGGGDASDVYNSCVEKARKASYKSVGLDVDETSQHRAKKSSSLRAESALEASPTQLQPESVDFPTDVSINNFEEFELWMESWLGGMLQEGFLTDKDILACLKSLLAVSDEHTALLLQIVSHFDLPFPEEATYVSGVSQFSDVPFQHLLAFKGYSSILSATSLCDASTFSSEFTSYYVVAESVHPEAV